MFLDLSRFLWNHYVICDWEEWVSVTFFHSTSPKIHIFPSFGIKGLSEFLFECLSTMCSIVHLTFSKNMQGHSLYYSSSVTVEEVYCWYSQVLEVFSNLKPIVFLLIRDRVSVWDLDDFELAIFQLQNFEIIGMHHHAWKPTVFHPFHHSYLLPFPTGITGHVRNAFS